MKKVTIKDIAREAGVAPSTVSSVLNGKARQNRISETMEGHIRSIATTMGYHPNQMAVSLRTGKTRTLGLIVEDISNVFFALLAKIIEEEADKTGYKVLFCSTENNDAKARERVKMLTLHRVDGLLITPTAGIEAEINMLLEQRIPVVLMDRYFPGLPAPYVLVDNYNGAQQGMQHLIDRGYRHIAFVTINLDQVQMHRRRQAYQDTLQANGLPFDEQLVLTLPYNHTQKAATQQVLHFFEQYPGLDAVFFATNYAGIYGLEAIKQRRLSIPGDLGVVCFDDHDIFRLHTPAITVIEQPIEAIAQKAMTLLLDQITDKTLSPEALQWQQPGKLVVREST